MATNMDMLIDVKSAIFLDEIITKTRVGGLPWKKVSGDRYSVAISEPPFCLVPHIQGNNWTIVVTRLNLAGGADGEFIYTLDVLADNSLYISLDSRQLDINNISDLYSQIESLNGIYDKLNRVVTFLNNIPTAPSTSVSNFIMDGGVLWGGEAKDVVLYFPQLTYGGLRADGNGVVQSIFIPQTSGGAVVGGSAVIG